MRRRPGRGWVLVAAVLVMLPACSQVRSTLTVTAGDDGPVACAPDGSACADHAKVCHNPTVHNLACDLDHLEKHIEWFGSVTAKAPDVWGQARLTQYREEFSREMAVEQNPFDNVLNGSLSRTDSAFFAFAATLQAAGAGSVPPPPDLTVIQTAAAAPAAGEAAGAAADSGAASPGAATAAVGAAAEAASVRRNPVTTIKRNITSVTGATLGLEPTLHLAQKARYLDFLHQLQRTNEGSDTADAPGYQLNLIRLPVSVLPGAHTDRGHGAEVTFTIDPVLGDDLLPTTFRRMVVNDLVQSLGFPLTKFLDEERQRTGADKLLTDIVRDALRRQDVGSPGQTGRAGAPPGPLPAPDRAVIRLAQGAASAPPRDPSARVAEANRVLKAAGPPWMASAAAPPAATVAADDPTMTRANARAAFNQAFTLPRLSFANGVQDRQAFPTSQLFDVYGPNFAFEIAFGAQAALQRDIDRNKYAHLPDVQSYLREETRAAYEFLAAPANRQLWAAYCTPELVYLIRSQQWEALRDRRRQFRDTVMTLTGSRPLALLAAPGEDGATTNPPSETRQYSLTSALAWAVIVDSALLNDRLVRDLRESATAKGLAPACPADAWPCFFLPDPPPDARQQFNAYVKMRWPVYVFALDPMSQDQNLADALSTRRETQLALAVAFTQGVIGANTMTRYTRRLEAEYETVALNRTQVGFAHGENTFGWRFYPRFQTPPTQSNLTVLVRDQLIGGPTPNALLRQRRLEPGPRECVALVIMPSFVPYMTVDAVSNWFHLPNPKHKRLDHTQAMHLSKTVRTLERCQHTVTDADCYRDNELKRLTTRVQQLASRLPAQTLTVPVPVVNTLGGFEMFSNGTTDLAPELYGWYGAPGVSADAESTTLFLVGDHFSPLHTRVIIGNTEIVNDGDAPQQRMLSRQVMQVTVKKTAVVPLAADGRRYVQAHVATPYGVSRELLVPLVTNAPAGPTDPKPGYTVPDKLTLTVRYGVDGRGAPVGQFKPHYQGATPAKLKFTWHDPLGQAPDVVEVRVRFAFRGMTLTVPCRCKVTATNTAEKEVVLDEAAVKKLGCELVRQIRDAGWLPLADNPLAAGLVSSEVLVTPTAADRHTAAEVKANGQLTVAFQAEGLCPGKDDCPCDVCAPPPAAPACPPDGPLATGLGSIGGGLLAASACPPAKP